MRASPHYGWLYIPFQAAFDTTGCPISDEPFAAPPMPVAPFDAATLASAVWISASQLKLNEISTHLRTGDRLIRLGERGNRSSDNNSEGDSLDERFHDY
jgi:hypothetical protein